MQKKTLIATALIAVLAFSIGYIVNMPVPHRNPKISANVYITENVNGVSAEIYSGNLITDLGEEFTRDLLIGDDAFDDVWGISLSNDATPLVSWTVLPNEVVANGFDRAEGTVTDWTNSGDYAFNVTKTFTASDTQQLQCAGLNWNDGDAVDNYLFAAATFTQTTFEASDTLTVTWVITVNAN